VGRINTAAETKKINDEMISSHADLTNKYRTNTSNMQHKPSTRLSHLMAVPDQQANKPQSEHSMSQSQHQPNLLDVDKIHQIKRLLQMYEEEFDEDDADERYQKKLNKKFDMEDESIKEVEKRHQKMKQSGYNYTGR
jgi:hypothetical protein